MIRRDQLERQKTFRGDGKVNKWSIVGANWDMKEESNKLCKVAQDRPLPLYLLHSKAGLQTSMAFTNHLLWIRISSPITTLTRTKDSIYFDEEIRGLFWGSFMFYLTPLLLLPQIKQSESCQCASPTSKKSITWWVVSLVSVVRTDRAIWD